MTKSKPKVNVEIFTKPYDGFRKVSEAGGITQSHDPRPGVYDSADKALIDLGRQYATATLGLAYPADNALAPDQKNELRSYASAQQGILESDAYASVDSAKSIEGFVREATKDEKKFKKLDDLLNDDEFAGATGVAGDKWRNQYREYVQTEKVASEVAKHGPAGVNDEARALFFGEAAKLYGQGIADKLKKAGRYTTGTIELAQGESMRAFMSGRAKKDTYVAAVKGVVRKKKIALVGAKETITDEALDEKFNDMREEKLVDYTVKSLDTAINKSKTNTELMRIGMRKLREIL